MDQVWQLEEALWAATTTGEVADYYAHTLSDDATIIVAGRRLRRNDVIANLSGQAPPWSEFEISDQLILLSTPETIVLTYRLLTWGPSVPDRYSGQVTSVYRWTPRGWALTVRQHTPDPDVVAGSWLPASLGVGTGLPSSTRSPT